MVGFRPNDVMIMADYDIVRITGWRIDAGFVMKWCVMIGATHLGYCPSE